MSVGGVFQLISNTGIQDRLIFATDQLMENVRCISRKNLSRLRDLHPDKTDTEIASMDEAWMPTLRNIEKTHILFINSSYKPFVAMAHEYSRVDSKGNTTLGGSATFTLPIIGEFVNDMVLYVKLTGLSAVSALDKVRYVEMLGHRLTKRVQFRVQNQVIDEYTTDNQNAYYQYKVPLHKEVGYLRNIGQETPKTGFLTADPTTDEVRSYRQYGDGPQTFKNIQLDVEMWLPILFWFKDTQNSLPNFLLPMNQTDIHIDFEDESRLVAFADYGGGGNYNVPKIDTCHLYVNHIFILPEINQIFLTRFGFQLIRVHRNHTQTLTNGSGSIHLHQLKWPIECLYVAFRPQVNLVNSGKWHRGAHIVERTVREAVVTGGAVIQINNAVYYDEQHVVSSLGIRAHDIQIYHNTTPEFYNNYLPSQYGEHIKTPRDLGWYMFNFAHTPGEQQPSGHFNHSRARELYLDYVSAQDTVLGSDIIRGDNPCDLIVVADCINFVLYQNNTLVLRFST